MVWLWPILIYFAVRLLGLVVLSWLAAANNTAVMDKLGGGDGSWFMAIAEYGYSNVPDGHFDRFGNRNPLTAYAFFPGFPYAMRALLVLPSVSPIGAALAVNVIAGSLAAVGVGRLGALTVRSMAHRSPLLRTSGLLVQPERVGLILVVLFAATPMSVVLIMAYTEALFCAFTVWALVAVLERRWVFAGVMAGLAGTVRPTAVVVIGVVGLAALIAFVQAWRRRNNDPLRRERVTTLAAMLISPVGYLGYLGIVGYVSGNPAGWFRIQDEGWDTSFDWGLNSWGFTMFALRSAKEVSVVGTVIMMVSVVVLVIVSAWARLPWPVWLYGALLTLSVVGSDGIVSSRPRLLLPAFVLLLPVAIGLARHRTGPIIAMSIGLALMSGWIGAHMLTVSPYGI